MLACKSTFSVGLVVLAGLCLLLLPSRMQLANSIHWNSQLVGWLLAIPVLLSGFLFYRHEFMGYLRLTHFSGQVQAARWAGIKGQENWRTFGPQAGLTIAVITLAVIYFQNGGVWPQFSQVPWISVTLLAFSNSLLEELLFRHSVVVAGEHHWRRHAPLVSGVIFGVLHYWGAPGGIPGVFMAGFLGWLLAKSIQETGGLFWAWSIHFLLDVIIYAFKLSEGI